MTLLPLEEPAAVRIENLIVQLSTSLKAKPDVVDFGTVFTDHMLTVEWNANGGWQTPLIRPFGGLSLHPACSALHYADELFEALKVYRGDDKRLRLFRPLLNLEQMSKSAKRACLPELWRDLVDCQQVLWLYGENHQITEGGTMNIFLHWINEDGDEELATSPLDGIFLPGVTRQSILDLARKWDEFKVSERYLTMGQLCSALKQQRLKEMFGSGRICHIGNIVYEEKSRIATELTDVQHGRSTSDWTYLV
ncbi:branched-chain-amino-acid aminotransferase, cytosolic-like [Gambusia affinis]|uniref:branched-chain-amino-acid aminotransferase, cytosolic-like n=1 Tax=Gambusia affinis TaxID=33528 RepID=UPI001CDD1035|nr:branched-chain-amino-acid aminotransferase, cytosolic-like [Gambusia affinis]